MFYRKKLSIGMEERDQGLADCAHKVKQFL